MKNSESNPLSKVRYLRARGYSFPEIKNKLGISFRKAYELGKTVAVDPAYLARLKAKRGGSHLRKIQREKEIEREVKNSLGYAKNRDLMFAAAALYWGEGEKIDFGFSNTDSEMIKLMENCLLNLFGVEKNRIKVSLRIYEDMDKESCLRFWSKITGVGIPDFKAVHVLKGRKNGKLKYGMCRLRVERPADLLKKFRAIRQLMLAPVAQRIE